MNIKRLPLLLIMTVTVVIFSGCSKGGQTAQPAAPGVSSQFVKGGLDDLRPESKLWTQAPEAVVAMLPQDLTEPKESIGIAAIKVKSLCDDNRIAFLIVWDDATKNETDEAGEFSDAVAVQLPLTAGAETPDPAMGQAGQPVHIHLWKASYERALQMDGWNLKQNFPNAAVDHYPFEAANDEQKEELTRQFTVGLAAANPLANGRGSCVDDLTAVGFGTLEHLPAQFSEGYSRYDSGRWSAVITRPLTVSEWESGLRPGDITFVAFAVWDGNKGQAGARKMRSAWVPLRLQGSV